MPYQADSDDDWDSEFEDFEEDHLLDDEEEMNLFIDKMGYPIGAQVVSSDFGTVEVEDEDHGHWLRQREQESVTRICSQCEQPKTMHRDYAICGSCADKIERGGGY